MEEIHVYAIVAFRISDLAFVATKQTAVESTYPSVNRKRQSSDNPTI